MTPLAGDGQGSEIMVESAKSGDRKALEQLVRSIKDPVYGLALRMLGEPTDAEDATQEILVKVVTRLDSFRGESRFTTWVYAVAANHLRSMRKGIWERRQSFRMMTERDLRVLPGARLPDVERTVLKREMQLMCLHGVLACLDRDHRLAYVLGEVLELDGVEGARVLRIEPATFRKRLSRARRRMENFMTNHCGLVRPINCCRCELWCKPAMEAGVLDPDRPKLAGHAVDDDPGDPRERLEDLDELHRVRALFRSLPAYRAPEHLVDELSRMFAMEGDGVLPG